MFTLPPAVLDRIRSDAQKSMKDRAHLYSVAVTRDTYGNEIVVSGLIASYPALIADVEGKENEIVSDLRTQGIIKSRVAKCLLPWDAVISPASILVVSGRNEWNIVYDTGEITEAYKVYTKLIITREDPFTAYADQIERSGG